MSSDKPQTSEKQSESLNLKSSAPDPSLPMQVVFILDITGSMSNQIEGVKSMVATFCSYERPGVNVHIWTYTESSSQCYVCKSQPGLSEDDLVDYVFKIKLCNPPEFPNANASGGDGPENVVAAVTSLLHSFTSQHNIVAFIITDANPHHAVYGNSSEAQCEKKWLTEKGHQNTDIFVLLNEVIETLNVTFVPVLYNTSQIRWYAQAAVLTQGCILSPLSKNSEELAKGLGVLLNSFQKVSVAREAVVDDESLQTICKGFQILDLNAENFEALESDVSNNNELNITVKKISDSQEIKASLMGLMETAIDKFSGKKAGKRCRTVSPEVVAASVKVLVMSMLDLTDSSLFSAEKFESHTQELLKAIQDSKADNAEYQIKQVQKWLEALPIRKAKLSDFTPAPECLQPVQCLVTLNSVQEYISTLEIPRTEEEVSLWMEIVLKLTICRLITIRFPLDMYGGPDFQDAWGASIKNVELGSILTTFAAVALRDLKTSEYLDPISRQSNNAAVIFAHPNDALLSEIYACLSCLISLHGLIQSHLVSGGLKVFPSIVPGIQSSVLLQLIKNASKKQAFTQAEWEVTRCLTWSIVISMDHPAANIVNSLKNAKGLNPVDNLSKIVAAIIYLVYQTKSIHVAEENCIELMFKEFSADVVAKILKARNKFIEDQKKEEKKDGDFEGTRKIEDGLPTDEKMNEYFVTESFNNFDPCLSYHESEKIVKKIVQVSAESIEKLKGLVKTSKAYKNSVGILKIFCDLLEVNLKTENVEQAFSSLSYNYFLSVSEDQLLNIFTESLLIKKRTARYVLDSEKKWQRPEGPVFDIYEICRENLAEWLKPKFSEWALTRKNYARKQLMGLVLEINEETPELCDEKLSKLQYKLLDTSYTLGRFDVIELFPLIKSQEQLDTLGVALCIGKWTSQPASQLKRFAKDIIDKYAERPEIKLKIEAELVKEAVCLRENPNRNGHSRDNIFPGVLGWNLEYHEKRLKAKSGNRIKNNLEKMKKYKEFYDQTMKELQENPSTNKKTIIDWVFGFHTQFNNIDKVTEMIKVINAKSSINSINSEVLQQFIVSLNCVSKKSKRRPLKRLLDYLSPIT